MSEFEKAFNKVAEVVHKMAVTKGWYDRERPPLELLMLIVSELGEACEALRDHNPQSEKITEFTQAEEELADAVIRIMDMSQAKGYNIGGAIVAKIAYNSGRENRHGGKAY